MLVMLQLPRTIADKFAKIPSGSYNSKSIKQALAVAHNSTNDAVRVRLSSFFVVLPPFIISKNPVDACRPVL